MLYASCACSSFYCLIVIKIIVVVVVVLLTQLPTILHTCTIHMYYTHVCIIQALKFSSFLRARKHEKREVFYLHECQLKFSHL